MFCQERVNLFLNNVSKQKRQLRKFTIAKGGQTGLKGVLALAIAIDVDLLSGKFLNGTNL